MTIFRKAAPADRAAVRALYESVKGGKYCVWNEYYPADLELDGDLAAGTLFLLEEESSLLGAVSIVPENELDGFDCWETPEGAREIGRLAICPARQGQGLSRLLLEGVLDELRRMGAAAVHLSAAKGNLPALARYRSLGFAFRGETDLYGNHYYLCELPLFPSDERLDKINENLLLLQKKEGLRFGSDALLLSDFLPDRHGLPAVELGSGSGVCSFLALRKRKCASVRGYELQSELCEMSARTAALNGITNFTPVSADVRAIPGDPALRGSAALVFTNPPYMTPAGKACADPGKQMSKHEISGGIAEFCAAAGWLLRTGGDFCAVIRPDRLADLFCAMRESGIEPKKLTPVLPRAGEAPCLLLCAGKKEARPSLQVTKPILLEK